MEYEITQLRCIGVRGGGEKKKSKNSELDLGTSKFESAASDLPPEGLFQKPYVEIQDFCNLYVKK